jgi:hypothetical protein
MNNNDDHFNNGTGNMEEVALTVLCVLVILLWTILCLAGLVFQRRTLEISVATTVAQEQTNTTSEQKDKKTRKEWISNMLVVREWASSDGATVEYGTSDSNPIVPEEDGSSKRKRDDVEAPYEMDRPSDEYSSESFSEEGPDSCVCAICLSEFQDHQLVCESNNSSCQHIFHKDCMIRWLTTKQHDDCPMCREPYLRMTVPVQEKVAAAT